MPEIIDSSPGADYVAPEVRDAMINFNASKDAPVVAYVSKMISVPSSELPQNKRRGGALTAEEAREMGRKKRAEIARQQALADSESADVSSVTDALGSTAIGETETPVEETPVPDEEAEHLIGFARMFSGTLNVGDEVYVLGPKFTPSNPHAAPEPQKVKITALYLMMGRGLEPLTSVPAGVVFGIGGLEGHLLKSGTLCSQLPGSLNLAGIQMGSEPIVRVALEPENPYDLDKMIKGLRLLVQSDPCAEYEQLPSGEHVILTAGELHLERCLKDLKERFAKCEIQAGEPIVPYRESIVAATEMNPPKDPNLPRGTVIGETASKHVSVRLRVRPLPPSVTEFLGKNAGAIKKLYSERRAEEEEGEHAPHRVHGAEDDGIQEAEQREIGQSLSFEDFKKQLKQAFAEAKGQKEIWTDVIEKITAFGPRRIGPNILVDTTKDGICGRAYVHPLQLISSTYTRANNLHQSPRLHLTHPRRHSRNLFNQSAHPHPPRLLVHDILRLPTRHSPGPLLCRARSRHRCLPRRRNPRPPRRRLGSSTRPRPANGRSDKSSPLSHPRRFPRLVAPHAPRYVQLRNPSLNRRSR